jgi:hypothetical protein
MENGSPHRRGQNALAAAREKSEITLARNGETLNTEAILCRLGFAFTQVPPMRRSALHFAMIFSLGALGCGKPPLKEFAPADGKFTILMPGNPTREVQNIGGMQMIVYHTTWRGEEQGIGFAELPTGAPGEVLDAAIKGMHDGIGGSNLNSSGKTVNGDGYREFEFLSSKYGGSVAGRGVIARNRFYLFFAMGKNAQLSNPDIRAFIDSFQLTDGPTPGKEEANPAAAVEAGNRANPAAWPASLELPPRPGSGAGNAPPRTPDPGTNVLTPRPYDSGAIAASSPPKPADPGLPPPATPPTFPGRAGGPGRRLPPNNGGDQPQMVGFMAAPEFQEAAPAGAVLVGFDVGLGYSVNSNFDSIVALRPIFRTGEKNLFGQLHGTDTRRTVREMAKPGYAVGAIHVKAGLMLDGFYLTYMKIEGDRLDPNDAYNSAWLGGPGGNGPTTIARNDGSVVVGIVGRENNKEIKAIGLQFGAAPVEPLPVREKLNPPPAPPKIPKSPRFIGGWNDPEFIEEAPPGGILVGFDIAVAGPFGTSIATVRAIYQVKGKDKDVNGLLHGTDTRRGIKERAKPGYAVGAITVKGGLWVDGFSITYMKLNDDKLDPTDFYESTWYGNPGNTNDVSTITGDGALAIGIIGRQGRKDLNALGLLFKTPDPASR